MQNNALYPQEVLTYVAEMKKACEQDALSVSLLTDKLSKGRFFDLMLKASNKKFKAFGSPILEEEEVKVIGMTLIQEDRIARMIEEGKIEVIGLRKETGKPEIRLAEKGRQYLKDKKKAQNGQEEEK